MSYFEVIPLHNLGRTADALTYRSELNLQTGSLVEVEVGKKSAVGVVVGDINRPKFETKEIVKQIEKGVLPSHLLKVAEWISEYYAVPQSQTFKSLLPRGLNKQRRESPINVASTRRESKLHLELTADQQKVLSDFTKSDAHVQLLEGVTGSGKTRIYIELVKKALEQKRSAIVLVPEIGLTQQIISEFMNAIDRDRIVLTHSQLTESERHRLWLKAWNAAKPLVIIGPRSALFSPLANLGLIIADEAHDASYKQDQQPKYDAIKVAAKIAKITDCKLLLGTATPNVVDKYQLLQLGATVHELSHRIGGVKLPKTEVVNLGDKGQFDKSAHLSNTALEAIAQNLKTKKQSMILLNRRGTSTSVTCRNCGWVKLCSSCSLPVSFHQRTSNLICHTCGTKSALIHKCPSCESAELAYRGVGTQKLESEVKKIFPNATISRVDRDSFDHKSLHEVHQKLYDADVDIIIGTQMISKGLDLPHLQTVVIANADGLFNLPDYSSAERAFQLIYQASGRSGRGKSQGETIIQSYSPEHPVIQLASQVAFKKFYDYEIDIRKKLGFPPFAYLMSIESSRKSPESAAKSLQNLSRRLNLTHGLTTLGPAPRLHEKIGNTYRWQLIVKSKQRGRLLQIAKKLPQNFTYTLDPISIL